MPKIGLKYYASSKIWNNISKNCKKLSSKWGHNGLQWNMACTLPSRMGLQILEKNSVREGQEILILEGIPEGESEKF